MTVLGSTALADISTHAPLAGRDDWFNLVICLYSDFNPRAPCGARLAGQHLVGRTAVFQPTRPLRGATGPLSSLRGRRAISTHAPLAGRDRFFSPLYLIALISTHAPLAGRDPHQNFIAVIGSNFNPRAPCGARRRCWGLPCRARWYFNPRAPCGARPEEIAELKKLETISTHAPLAGRDKDTSRRRLLCKNFNPRAPCGARPFVVL